jgi:hypothetical protein
MRPRILYLFLLCLFVAFVAAWTKEDHEIFRLRDEVEISEGVDVTFYDFLGVKPSATQEDIVKAFKKKSRSLHPDKVKHSYIASKSTAAPTKPGDKKRKPGVHASKGPSEREVQRFLKEATARYGRLGVVADILKGESRARYDHFLKNGFPAWRGSGWYYKRYRPGFGTVLVGLFVMFAGVAHYVVLRLSYTKQREFVDRYIRHARKAAWGSENALGGIPGLNGSAMAAPTPPANEEEDPYAGMNRKQRRQMEREEKKPSKKAKLPKRHGTETPPISSAVEGPKKRVEAPNGKVLVVDSIGNVFLEEEQEDNDGNVTVVESLLDVDEIHQPTIYDTAVFRLPVFLYHKITDKFLKRGDFSEIMEVLEEAEPAQALIPDNEASRQDSSEGFEILETSGVPEQANGGPRRRNKKNKK